MFTHAFGQQRVESDCRPQQLSVLVLQGAFQSVGLCVDRAMPLGKVHGVRQRLLKQKPKDQKISDYGLECKKLFVKGKLSASDVGNVSKSMG